MHICTMLVFFSFVFSPLIIVNNLCCRQVHHFIQSTVFLLLTIFLSFFSISFNYVIDIIKKTTKKPTLCYITHVELSSIDISILNLNFLFI